MGSLPVVEENPVNGHSAITQSTISGNSAMSSSIGSGAYGQSAFPFPVENSTIRWRTNCASGRKRVSMRGCQWLSSARCGG